AAEAPVGFDERGARAAAGGGEGGGDTGGAGATDEDVGGTLHGNFASGLAPGCGVGGGHRLPSKYAEDELETAALILSMSTWLRDTPWRTSQRRRACIRRPCRWRCGIKDGCPR